jgi:hypothetical protein
MSISLTDTTYRSKPLYGGLSGTLPGRVDLSTTCLELSVRRGTIGQTACWTKSLKLLKWWPMVTDHPFSSSSILVRGRTENPRVGGSIPSQATS